MNPQHVLYALGGAALLYAIWDAYKDKITALIPKASIPEIPDNSKPATKPVDVPLEQDMASRRYIQVQNCLLDIRELAHDCPEALVAIDAAIRATVAMVVKPEVINSPLTTREFQEALKAARTGDTITTVPVVKAAPLPPRTVDTEAAQ